MASIFRSLHQHCGRQQNADRHSKAPLSEDFTQRSAIRLLAQLPATSANYEVAKQLLKERYANKRIIIRTHLELIIKFLTIQRESLVTVFIENTLALLALGQDSSDSDYIWVYILAEKLDSETRRQWELSTTGDDTQTMKEMTKILEE